MIEIHASQEEPKSSSEGDVFFASESITCYNGAKVKSRLYHFRPKETVTPKEKKERLKAAIDKMTDEDVVIVEQRIGQSHTLSSRFQLSSSDNQNADLPSVPPLLWKNRDKNKEKSPAAFIRSHYEPWLGRGLTSGHLRKVDQTLYVAYAREVAETPSSVIRELPIRQRKQYSTPEEALQKQRASKLKYYHKNKPL